MVQLEVQDSESESTSRLTWKRFQWPGQRESESEPEYICQPETRSNNLKLAAGSKPEGRRGRPGGRLSLAALSLAARGPSWHFQCQGIPGQPGGPSLTGWTQIMIQLQVASGTGQVESSYSTATARLAQLRVRVPAPAASPDSEPAKPDSETQAQNAPGPYVYCHQQYEPPAGHAAYRHAARAENLMIHLIQIRLPRISSDIISVYIISV